ncbi:MAG TPA: hypothetical protein DCS43_12920 [Verrucomicrobia bacterium]|nr:hypothetical protein [Verrucomicrobiota bacterium]
MQRLKSQECLVALKAPELACSFEAALVLSAGRFHRTGSERLIKCFARFGAKSFKFLAYLAKIADHIECTILATLQPCYALLCPLPCLRGFVSVQIICNRPYPLRDVP